MKIPRLLSFWFFFLTCSGLLAQGVDQQRLIQDIAFLSSDQLEGRNPLSQGSLLARERIKGRFQELGLSSQYNEFTQYFTFYSKKENKHIENAANIIGFIPGKESSKIIVLLAHYDHLGKKGESIFNGADDNASGTAALLALSAYFSENKPNYSMIFAALDAEEEGLQGAKALINDFPFPLDQVLLAVNMDMISRSKNQEIFAVGTYHYPDLRPILENAAIGQKVKLRFGHDKPGTGSNDWTNSSDHAVFHREGIPFIYFGVEDHEDYHRESDTFENIDQDFYFHSVNLILHSILALDRDLLKQNMEK